MEITPLIKRYVKSDLTGAISLSCTSVILQFDGCYPTHFACGGDNTSRRAIHAVNIQFGLSETCYQVGVL